MRILVVTPTFLPTIGGAELAIYEVYSRLARSHDVYLLTRESSSFTRKWHAADDYQVSGRFAVKRFRDRITLNVSAVQRVTAGSVPPFSISAFRAIAGAVVRFMPDVIHAYYAVPTGLAAAALGILKRIPVVLTFTGRDVPGPETPPLWKYYDRLVARMCSDVTYVSNFCRAALYGSAGRNRGHIIPNGVDVKKYTPCTMNGTHLRQKLGVGHTAIVLFALQRLVQMKRIDVLIHSMKHIVRGCPETVLIVGGSGPERPRLEMLVQELGLGDQVRFTGYIPDAELPHYFALADVFVFHSVYETFGMVVIQAMAAGKPIVTVSSTAIPEVVDDNITGVLVQPLNPEALSEAVLALIRDPDRRSQLGKNARVKAVDQFAWDDIARQYEMVLKTAAGVCQ